MNVEAMANMPLVGAMRCCTREGSKAMISEDEQASLSTESPVFAHNNNKGSRDEAMREEVALRRLMLSCPVWEQLQVRGR